MDENATSSSRNGATPVHSESRQPSTSSSSAIGSKRSARPGTLTRLPQPLLDGEPVDAAVLPVELVREALHLVRSLAWNEQECDRLLAAPELLARIRLGE